MVVALLLSSLLVFYSRVSSSLVAILSSEFMTLPMVSPITCSPLSYGTLPACTLPHVHSPLIPQDEWLQAARAGVAQSSKAPGAAPVQPQPRLAEPRTRASLSLGVEMVDSEGGSDSRGGVEGSRGTTGVGSLRHTSSSMGMYDLCVSCHFAWGGASPPV